MTRENFFRHQRFQRLLFIALCGAGIVAFAGGVLVEKMCGNAGNFGWRGGFSLLAIFGGLLFPISKLSTPHCVKCPKCAARLEYSKLESIDI